MYESQAIKELSQAMRDLIAVMLRDDVSGDTLTEEIQAIDERIAHVQGNVKPRPPSNPFAPNA